MIDFIAFDQYQRYKNAEIAVNLIREEGQKFKILEVGANEHKNLEKFLPYDEIIYIDKNLPDYLLDDNSYVKADACDMDFEDKSFDIVIALDVFEHIENEKKEKFLNEIKRVCKKAFIIGAPFYSKENAFAESMLNDIFVSYFNQEYIWLKEHIENGLPKKEMLVSYLKENTDSYYGFSHGDVFLWQRVMKAHFKSVEGRSVLNYLKSIDLYYNQNIFEMDYFPKNSYREFFIGFNEKENKKEKIEKYFERKKSKKDIQKTDHLNFMLEEFDYISLRQHMDVKESVYDAKKTEILTEITKVNQNINTSVQEDKIQAEEVKNSVLSSINDINNSLSGKDDEIINILSEIKNSNNDFESRILSLVENYEKRMDEIKKDREIYENEMKDKISNLKLEVDTFFEKNKKLEEELRQNKQSLEEAKEKIHEKEMELMNIYTSRGWKYLTKIKRLFGK